MLRKGRLGRTIDGVYIHFSQQNQQVTNNDETSSLLERDITNNYLSLKRKNIDFEKLKNLPYKPKDENLEYSIKLLSQIGAINTDNKDLKITEFDIDTLGLEFGIPIYYVNAIVSYSGSFNDETDMNYAYFIATYISLIITKDRLIITKEISEELAQYHDENSDIATLYNVLSILLCSKDKSMNKLRYCFSKINDLKDQLITMRKRPINNNAKKQF